MRASSNSFMFGCCVLLLGCCVLSVLFCRNERTRKGVDNTKMFDNFLIGFRKEGRRNPI